MASVNVYVTYQDTDFTSTDSPIVLDVSGDLTGLADNGDIQNGNSGFIENTGNYDILVEESYNGTTYGDQYTICSRDGQNFQNAGIKKIRITHSGDDSAYFVKASARSVSDIDYINGTVNSRLQDKNGNWAEFDTVCCGIKECGYPVVMDSEHHKIHEEKHYTCQQDDQNVDTTKYFLIKAPDTDTRVHYIFNFRSSLNGTVSFYRSPTITDVGNILNTYNNDENSSNEAELLIYEDPTISDTGSNKLLVNIIGSDGLNPNGSDGGFTSRSRETILGQGLYYLIEYVPESSDQRINLCNEWYEV